MPSSNLNCICIQCGTRFHKTPALIKRGGIKFCSKGCQNAAKGNIADRFWARVNKSGPTVRVELSPCWLWTGSQNRYGYGVFKLDGKLIMAHRFSWELHNQPLSEKMRALHKCDNPPCVNPEHLFAGTKKDNVVDMVLKGRHSSGNGSRKLTEAQVRAIRTRYAAGNVTQLELASEHGVTDGSINKIIHRRTWPLI